MATTYSLLFAVALCLVSVSCYKEELRGTMKNCKNGVEVTQDELEEFIRPTIPKSRDEKCLMACVMKTYNLINDGVYDTKIALAVSPDFLKNDPEKLQQVKDVINHCKDDLPPKMDDDCELAGKIIECVVKYKKEAGIY